MNTNWGIQAGGLEVSAARQSPHPSFFMGIRDRDYMRRRPEDEDDAGRPSAAGSRLVAGLGRFFERYPRFGVWLALVLGVLILAGLIVARLSMH